MSFYSNIINHHRSFATFVVKYVTFVFMFVLSCYVLKISESSQLSPCEESR